MSTQYNKYQSLLKLSRSENLFGGYHKEFIKEVLVSMAKELGIARASFWQWDELDESITCVFLYNQLNDSFSSGDILSRKDYPRYFKAFNEDLLINAENALTDSRTSEFRENYLDKYNIKSMLDVQVNTKGKLYGVICLEHIDEMRQWSQQDEIYLISAASYIAQSYNVELRINEEKERAKSETNYTRLFYDSPIPMWVYDQDSLEFLAVNKSAIQQYGYSEEEFLQMSIYDIRPESEKSKLEDHLKERGDRKWLSRQWLHRYKDGTLINVNTSSDWTNFNNKKVRIVMAMNITQETNLRVQQEEYIKKLTQFARYASHNLRGPVARMLGLFNVLEMKLNNAEISFDISRKMMQTAKEIDDVIHELNRKLD